jgi:hypothetical protein
MSSPYDLPASLPNFAKAIPELCIRQIARVLARAGARLRTSDRADEARRGVSTPAIGATPSGTSST